jgi:septal ring factor EnvC (AmiA/AmiB activator)
MTTRIRTKPESVYVKRKELHRKLKSVSVDLEILLKEKERIDTQVSKSRTEQKRIEKEINDLEESMKNPEITDHARVQFFNRCLGFDINKIDAMILSERTKQIVKELGETSGKFPIKINDTEKMRSSFVRTDFKPQVNYAIRMKKGFVVTVIED